MELETLKNNLDTIQSKLGKQTRLVAVTKMVDSQVNRQLFELGVRHFGENRPQGFKQKFAKLEDLRDEIQWHFIGNLQSRQVKEIINDVDYLHALDRLSLAKEIQKRAENPVKCFLQVNVSGEESKSGFQPEEVMDIIQELKNYDKIILVGMMTMAPIDSSDEELHTYFSRLREVQQSVSDLNICQAPSHELSMGMSQDYQIAIEEGATFIRVGRALFEE